jgi:hypothetical protein
MTWWNGNRAILQWQDFAEIESRVNAVDPPD